MSRFRSPLLAVEIARAGLNWSAETEAPQPTRPWVDDIGLQLELAQALCEARTPLKAQDVLEKLCDQIAKRPVTSGDGRVGKDAKVLIDAALGRVFADLAELEIDPAKRGQNLGQSIERYSTAWVLSRDRETGIRLATQLRLTGQTSAACQIADEVQRGCEARLADPERIPDDDERFELHSTLGLAELVRGRVDEAGLQLHKAYELARNDHGLYLPTRGQAGRLLSTIPETGSGEGVVDRRAALLDQWMPRPAVVIFVGHALDSPEREAGKFPHDRENSVREALKMWLLDQNRPLIGFAAAANGAEPLFHELIHELHGESHVVLPYEIEEYKQLKVDLPNDTSCPTWSQRFDEVIRQATSFVTVSPNKFPSNGISFKYSSNVLLGMAMSAANRFETTPIGLCVWDGKPGKLTGSVGWVVAGWEGSGVPVWHLNMSKQDPAKGDNPISLRQPTAADVRLNAVVEYSMAESDAGVRAMLFGDVKGFSGLTEREVRLFVEYFWGPIGAMLRVRYAEACELRSTSGDGIYLAFRSVREAGRCALDILDVIRRCQQTGLWRQMGLRENLEMRIALHAGPVFFCNDPVTGRDSHAGAHITRAARLEPKTPPGEVYASEAFAALAAVDRVTDFSCEYVQSIEWAKHYGTYPTYQVRRKVIDR
ncbi:MAG: hypothetical protein NT069_01380 [Planctomycetota bacterium]|nr:hypothetical protein [Planctomycetota bacterium]